MFINYCIMMLITVKLTGFHLYNKICNQYFKILKRLEIYIGKWPSSPYKKAVGTFLPIFKTNLQKRL
jgi:hypothetical protein